MKTLGKSITRHFFVNPETGWDDLKARWKEMQTFFADPMVEANASEEAPPNRAALNLIYMAVRGRDYRKAFTPITNEKKLANGAAADWGYRKAYACMCNPNLWKFFDGILTDTAMDAIRGVIPKPAAPWSPNPFALPEYDPRPFEIEVGA